jgi:hypothetical protein
MFCKFHDENVLSCKQAQVKFMAIHYFVHKVKNTNEMFKQFDRELVMMNEKELLKQ